jgi:hypothetical protein
MSRDTVVALLRQWLWDLADGDTNDMQRLADQIVAYGDSRVEEALTMFRGWLTLKIDELTHRPIPAPPFVPPPTKETPPPSSTCVCPLPSLIPMTQDDPGGAAFWFICQNCGGHVSVPRQKETP